MSRSGHRNRASFAAAQRRVRNGRLELKLEMSARARVRGEFGRGRRVAHAWCMSPTLGHAPRDPLPLLCPTVLQSMLCTLLAMDLVR